MSDSDSKGIWAVIGKISAVIALILGLSSVYSHFFTKEISLDASGNCEAFIVPNTYLRAINADDIFLTADEIEKLLPEKLEDKDKQRKYTEILTAKFADSKEAKSVKKEGIE